MSEKSGINLPLPRPNMTAAPEHKKKATLIGLVIGFTKLRLAALVVLSAALCYIAASKEFSTEVFSALIAGGFLVTAASNGFNQIMERNLDKLMSRTCNRPLPAGHLTVWQGLFIAILCGVCGLYLLSEWVGPVPALLGGFALFSYTLIYTPLKRITPFAVFVGAFPGAIPPMLGWVAASGSFDIGAFVVFGIQFIWQFPHFWAIAWIMDEDYKKAGFRMLPSPGGRDKRSAFLIMVYSFFLIPASCLPYFFGISGMVSLIAGIVLSLLFFLQAVKLFKQCNIPAARELMFGSFVYLPLVQIAMLFPK